MEWSGRGERMGGTRGSQFQLHIHSSPLAVERLRNYLQPFTFHALSAISPFFVDGVSNQLRNFCTLRFPAPPHTHTHDVIPISLPSSSFSHITFVTNQQLHQRPLIIYTHFVAKKKCNCYRISQKTGAHAQYFCIRR